MIAARAAASPRPARAASAEAGQSALRPHAARAALPAMDGTEERCATPQSAWETSGAAGSSVSASSAARFGPAEPPAATRARAGVAAGSPSRPSALAAACATSRSALRSSVSRSGRTDVSPASPSARKAAATTRRSSPGRAISSRSRVTASVRPLAPSSSAAPARASGEPAASAAMFLAQRQRDSASTASRSEIPNSVSAAAMAVRPAGEATA